MDQQPPSSPTPPQTPTPPQEPTPLVAPPNAPAGPTSPTGSAPMQPHSNKNLIIGVVVAAVVALIAIVAIVIAITLSADKNGNNQNNNTNTNQQDDDDLRAANAETAKSLFDFRVVCENGSISNAADYKAPYKVAAFSKNSTTRSATTVTLPYDADYKAEYDEFEDANVVACLDEKAGTAVKSKTCDFKSGDETVKLDYYALKYTLTLREAKTGKLIKELGEVNAPATTCPFFVSYSKDDPKYYARPDDGAIDMAIKKFLAE